MSWLDSWDQDAVEVVSPELSGRCVGMGTPDFESSSRVGAFGIAAGVSLPDCVTFPTDSHKEELDPLQGSDPVEPLIAL
jgi:hypothetical protein